MSITSKAVAVVSAREMDVVIAVALSLKGIRTHNAGAGCAGQTGQHNAYPSPTLEVPEVGDECLPVADLGRLSIRHHAQYRTTLLLEISSMLGT